ncbi:hypothetical protein GLW05_09850 [Pontibacillus yanchengensis]|uniref:Endonuclease n=2 Tax=Pontibacillus yanchengensis TaxID=462910 RepID=A0A6I5A0X5_9BACI|nr:hypothetical protein [Pontibacillus yanchengensis]
MGGMKSMKRAFSLLLSFLVGLSMLAIANPVQAETNSSLIFSEYVEGSGYNKAIELYNGTGEPIDLSDYTVVSFTNGASQDPGDGYANELNLSGTLEDGEVYVIAHSDADQAILDQADVTGSSYFYEFNGDDAVVLFQNYDESTRQGTVVDSIGKVGEDPGDGWTENATSTKDSTLVRKETVLAGDTDVTDAYDPTDEWIALPKDTFSNLGKYESVQPPEPKDEYTATVERVVDGDTIKIESSILGADTVRYLNIDTPETYHMDSYDSSLITTNPNHSQKYHGVQATEHLQTLLQPGDEVTLDVSEEVTDDYGRLLAEVIRTSDGLNTNLNMVEKGYAVTYFIAPIGSEETYQMYQQAAKTAQANNFGIWSEETPLLELPFEFRARYDQKGYSKYVGNSETNQYVRPANWEQVPVENRIFFWTEQEAIQAGYEPAFERGNKIADARYAPEGSNVAVQGTVIAKDDKNYYIQDDTAGIVVRTDAVNASIGDVIRASGNTEEYYGLLQVVTDDVTIVEENARELEPKLIDANDLGESLESQLVSLQTVSVESVDKYNDFQANDESGSFVINSDENLLEVGTTYDTITGYVTYSFGQYKVVPRSADDIVKDIPAVSIQEARESTIGSRVNIEGIVTAAFPTGGKINYYVQDETAGIVVRAEDLGANVGDRIQAKAVTEEYFDLLQLQPSEQNATIIEKDVGVPQAKPITSNEFSEELEGQLVKINLAKVTDVDAFHNYTAQDEQGSFVIDSDNDLVEVDKVYESITGVLTYNYDEYKIMPRSAEDVVALNLFEDHLDGSMTLEDVATQLVELEAMFGSDKVGKLLDEQLSSFITTNGNTSQHIDSTVHHILKSMQKMNNDKEEKEMKKIEHELEKIMKKDEKSNGKKDKGNKAA